MLQHENLSHQKMSKEIDKISGKGRIPENLSQEKKQVKKMT